MTALVTVAQVDNALRLDLAGDIGDASADDDGDTARLDDIELKITQATDIVLDYITDPDPYWDVDTVPGRVSAAIILVIKSLYDDSAKAAMLAGLAGGDLANPVVGLLYRLRDPTLA